MKVVLLEMDLLLEPRGEGGEHRVFNQVDSQNEPNDTHWRRTGQ